MKDMIFLALRLPLGASDADRMDIVSVQSEEELHGTSGVFEMRVCYVVGRDASSHGRKTSTFGASYSRHDNECIGGVARLTNGGFFVDPECLRSRGIGTYVMDRIVEWVQKHAPDARVREIVLADDKIPENSIRKPRVYESVGVEFDGQRSKRMLVRDLKRVNPEKILKEYDLYSMIEKLQWENTMLKTKTRHQNEYIGNLEAKLAKRFWGLFG